MNRTLRHLFYVATAMIVILGLSSSILQVVLAPRLNADTRNARTIYDQYRVPRGSILASDGTVLASSQAVSDAFSYQRTYADGQVFAPITGFYSITIPADRGIEASRDSLLSGTSDSMWWRRVRNVFTGQEYSGETIKTSIDADLQRAAYNALTSRGYEGAVVAIEPSTGRILAMASTPSYDPNLLASHDGDAANASYTSFATAAGNPMQNKATSELYPPGSTFKIVVAAAALESGQYDTDTQIPAGHYTLPGTTTSLVNSDGSYPATRTLENAFAVSSNTAFAQLGVALGADTVGSMAQALGFGTSLVVDDGTSDDAPMKATASNFPTNVSDAQLALQCIGQGDTTETALQNAMITATVANGGVQRQPTLVDAVVNSDLTVVSSTRVSTLNTPMSEETADKLTQMMVSMVNSHRSVYDLNVNGIQAAAKTGTAQINNNTQVDTWVDVFMPADDPQIAVSVVIHGLSARSGDTYALATAAPVAHDVLEEAMAQ